MGVIGAFLLLLVPSVAGAIPPFEVPQGDRAPRVAAEEGVVTVASVGAPDERLGRLSAARLSARHAARERALAALHAWADEALASVRACPRDARAVHRAIDERATVIGTRPLPDGGAVLVVTVPLDALRDAASLEGVPWSA